jgi:hypothetical protein
MDGYQLTASIIGSLAWPRSAGLIGFWYRNTISQIIQRVRSVKAGGVEVSIAEQSEAFVELLPEEKPSPSDGALIRGDQPTLTNLILPSIDVTAVEERKGSTKSVAAALVSPAERVLAAWREAEFQISDLARDHGASNYKTALKSASYLVDKRVIPLSVFNAIVGLGQIRTEVAHAKRHVDEVDAFEYTRSIAEVLRAIELIERPAQGGTFDVLVMPETAPVIATKLKERGDVVHVGSYTQTDGRILLYVAFSLTDGNPRAELVDVVKAIDPSAEFTD